MLGGVATVAAVVLALIESRKWRERVLESKRFEVAYDAIGTCFAVCDALRFVSDAQIPEQWNGLLGADKDVWCREVYAQRWAANAETFRQLVHATGLAEAFLVNPQIQLLHDLRHLQQNIRAAQERWLASKRSLLDAANQELAIVEPLGRVTELVGGPGDLADPLADAVEREGSAQGDEGAFDLVDLLSERLERAIVCADCELGDYTT